MYKKSILVLDLLVHVYEYNIFVSHFFYLKAIYTIAVLCLFEQLQKRSTRRITSRKEEQRKFEGDIDVDPVSL